MNFVIKPIKKMVIRLFYRVYYLKGLQNLGKIAEISAVENSTFSTVYYIRRWQFTCGAQHIKTQKQYLFPEITTKVIHTPSCELFHVFLKPNKSQKHIPLPIGEMPVLVLVTVQDVNRVSVPIWLS